MLLNIALGFVLLWIFGVFLYRKHSLIVLAVAPFAFVIDAVGFRLGMVEYGPRHAHRDGFSIAAQHLACTRF
jgi:hypothetical protein